MKLTSGQSSVSSVQFQFFTLFAFINLQHIHLEWCVIMTSIEKTTSITRATEAETIESLVERMERIRINERMDLIEKKISANEGKASSNRMKRVHKHINHNLFSEAIMVLFPR